jgi:large subunit ribosomal protein L25
MAIAFEINAALRTEKGKGASRRLRHAGKVPAVLYGSATAPLSLVLEQNHLSTFLQQESFYSNILHLKIGKQIIQVVLKALQRHPYKDHALHLDFLRVKADEKIRMQLPLHFIGAEQSPGVKHGGIVSHIINSIEVSCLPHNLPEFMAIDISQLELDKGLHLSQLQLPPGIESIALSHNQDPLVVSIHLPAKLATVEPSSNDTGNTTV